MEKTVTVHLGQGKNRMPIRAVRSIPDRPVKFTLTEEHAFTGNSGEPGACAIQRCGLASPESFPHPVLGMEVTESAAYVVWKINKQGRHYVMTYRHKHGDLVRDFDAMCNLPRSERAANLLKRFGEEIHISLYPPSKAKKRKGGKGATKSRKATAKRRGHLARLLTQRQYEADMEKELYAQHRRAG